MMSRCQYAFGDGAAVYELNIWKRFSVSFIKGLK